MKHTMFFTILVFIAINTNSQSISEVYTGELPVYNLTSTASRMQMSDDTLVFDTGSVYCGDQAFSTNEIGMSQTWSINTWPFVVSLIVSILLSVAITYYSLDLNVKQGKALLVIRNFVLFLFTLSIVLSLISNVIVFTWAPIYKLNYNTDCYYFQQLWGQTTPLVTYNNFNAIFTDCTPTTNYYPQWDITINTPNVFPLLSNTSGTWWYVESMKTIRNERCYPFKPDPVCTPGQPFCQQTTLNLNLDNGCWFSSNVAIGTIFRVVQAIGYTILFNPTQDVVSNYTICQGFTNNCTTYTNQTAWLMNNPSSNYPKGLLYSNDVVIDLNDPIITARLFSSQPTFDQLYNTYISGWDLQGNPIYNYAQTTILPYVEGFNCIAQFALNNVTTIPLMCVPNQTTFNVDQNGIYSAWVNAGVGCSIQWMQTLNTTVGYYWPTNNTYLLRLTTTPTMLPPGALISYTYGNASTYSVPNATNITSVFNTQIQGTRSSFYDPSLSGQLENQSNTLLFVISLLTIILAGILTYVGLFIRKQPRLQQSRVVYHEMLSQNQ